MHYVENESDNHKSNMFDFMQCVFPKRYFFHMRSVFELKTYLHIHTGDLYM